MPSTNLGLMAEWGLYKIAQQTRLRWQHSRQAAPGEDCTINTSGFDFRYGQVKAFTAL